MTKKIFHAIFESCLTVLLASVILTVTSTYKSFVEEQVSQLEHQTQTIAALLNRSNSKERQSILEEDYTLFEAEGIRFCLIDPDGVVVYDSLHPDSEANHKDRQEIIEAEKNGHGFAIRHSQTVSTETYNSAVRLNDGYFLRLSQTHSSLLALFGRVIKPLILFVPVLAGLAWILARLLSRHIVTPINAIDLSHPLDSIPYEQLRPLLERLDENNRQIQKQIREIEERTTEFDALRSSMEEGMVMVLNSGRTAFINESASRIFSLNDPENYRENLTLKALIDQALSGANLQEYYRVGRKVYSLQAEPVRRDHQILGAMVLALDVTEKQLARKRRQEFTANVTHELKTPLQTISSSAELLSSGLVAQKDIPRFVGYIEKESHRMTEMVNNIIRLSRLENEDDQQSRKDIPVIDLYERAGMICEKLQEAALLKKISLSLEGYPVSVRASEKDLDGIIGNLAENAIRYTPEGGCVQIQVSSIKNGARLVVRDNGIGIAPELHERIFERFFTADPSRSRTGTGLGLAIVSHTVENLSGQIHLESAPGKGSSFTVDLPAD